MLLKFLLHLRESESVLTCFPKSRDYIYHVKRSLSYSGVIMAVDVWEVLTDWV